jgi:ABC-type multidrug transport system ATPase subunit
MAVGYNECFGLLGPNGAGKTTTINMLSGNLRATSGRSQVAGFDTVTDLDQVYTRLGVCPQVRLYLYVSVYSILKY